MAVISYLQLSQFMNCPYVGAIAPGPVPTRVNPPVNAFLPVISGALTIGSVLTTTTGAWTGQDPIIYTYQWLRAGVVIAGATAKTYTIAANDVGLTLAVTVTARNAGGATQATAASVGPIGGLLNSYLPIVTGTLSVGSTLTTTNGGWVGTPPPTFAYSWQRDGVNISGATSNTYVTVQADAGHLITSGVTATNSSGSLIAYSGAVGPIASAVINDVLPIISGPAVVGSTLTVANGTWEGTPAPTFAYKWNRNGVFIAGATSNTYQLVSADLAATITCTVTGTNASGSVSAISNSLGPVTAFANLTLPVISGTTITGSRLTTTDGTWAGNATNTYTYQWLRDGVNISGATTNGYVLTTTDLGTMISVRVTATNPTSSANATANSVGPVVLTPSIALSNSLVAKSAAIGSTVGVFSVSGGSGSYTYTLTSNPGSLFAISGSNLNVAAALTGGTVTITVQATGGALSAPPASFTISIAAISLTSSTVLDNAAIGTTVGTVSVAGGTGSYTFALTDPSGKFVISGSNLNVAAILTAGSYPVTVTATGGVPTPILESFMLTVIPSAPPNVVVKGAWFNGLSYPGIEIVANDIGGQKYWFNGLPAPQLRD